MWSIVMNLTITVVNSVTKRPTKLSWENTWVSNMVMTLTITCVTSVTIKATDKAFLGRHMNVKHGNDCDNNSCQLCDYKSHDKSFLRKHMNFKHYKEVSKETFCCDICYACPVHGTWTGRGTGQGNGSGERVRGTGQGNGSRGHWYSISRKLLRTEDSRLWSTLQEGLNLRPGGDKRQPFKKCYCMRR